MVTQHKYTRRICFLHITYHEMIQGFAGILECFEDFRPFVLERKEGNKGNKYRPKIKKQNKTKTSSVVFNIAIVRIEIYQKKERQSE